MELSQLQTTCKALRSEVTTLYEQRGRREDDTVWLQDCRWRVLLLLSAMKAGLRSTFLAAETRRTRVQEQKDVAEAHQLQLQNLLYEKDHLVREIRRCRGFSTKEMDRIEFQDGNLPIQVDPDVHRDHLNRLTGELDARKSLQTELKALKLEISKIQDITKRKEAFLKGLPDQVAGIEAATKGLQEYMGKPVSMLKKRHERARNELSTPLYALFCELEAYQTACKEAGKHVGLEIVDSPDIQPTERFRKRAFPAALAGEDQKCKRQKGTPSRSPSVGLVGVTPSRSPSLKREPESGEIVLVQDGCHELIENETSDLGIDALSEQEPSNETSIELWKPHAKALQLTITVQVAPEEPNGSLTDTFHVLFYYFPMAKMVTADVAPTSSLRASLQRHLLANLFPNDNGRSIPRSALQYAFYDEQKASTPLTFPPQVATGRPYAWAQWICGLTLAVRDDPPSRRLDLSVRTVMSQLVTRFTATLVLNQHLERLAHGLDDEETRLVHPRARHLFPRALSTHLTAWADVSAASDDVREVFEMDSPYPRSYVPECQYFRAEFANGETRVSALVEISPEYPVRAPRFLFQPRTANSREKEQGAVYENQWKEIEVEVNAYYDELIPDGTEMWLLLHQLRKIELCLDVVCGSGDYQNVWSRERRGKDRRHAMVRDVAVQEQRHR